MKQTRNVLLLLCLFLQGVVSAAQADNTVTQTLKETRTGVIHNGVTYEVKIYECVATGTWAWDRPYYTCEGVVTGLPNESRVTIEPFDITYGNRSCRVNATGFATGTITNATVQRLDILTADFLFSSDYLHAENLAEVHAKNLTVNKISSTYMPNLKKLYISDNARFKNGSCSSSVLTDVYLADPLGPTWGLPNDNSTENVFGNRIGSINLYVSERFWDCHVAWSGFAGDADADNYYRKFQTIKIITTEFWDENIDVTVTAKGAWFSPYVGDAEAVFSSTNDPVTKTFSLVPYSDFLIRVQKTYGSYTLKHVYLNGKDIISEMTEDGSALIYQLRDLTSDTFIQVEGESGSQYVELYNGEGGTLTYTDQDGEAQNCKAGKMNYIRYDKTKGEIAVTVTPQEGWEFSLFTIGGMPITEPSKNPSTDYQGNGYLIDNGNGTYKFYINDDNLNKSRVVVFKRKAGDVNGDGAVDVNDIDEVVKHINEQP